MQACPKSSTTHRLATAAVVLTTALAVVVPALAAASGPSAAAVINPCVCTGRTAEALHAEFPTLSPREIDRLLFSIGEMESRAGLAR